VNKFFNLMIMTFLLSLKLNAQVAVWHETWPVPTAAEIAAQKAADFQARRNEIADQQKYFIPRDPWRITKTQTRSDGVLILETKTNYAKGADWMQFYGKVTQIVQDGIVVDGWVGPPLDYEYGYTNMLITVTGFPYKVHPGVVLQATGKFVARVIYFPHDEKSYQQVARFDYGKPTSPPGTKVGSPVNAIAADKLHVK
jgi:hypothetical protein